VYQKACLSQTIGGSADPRAEENRIVDMVKGAKLLAERLEKLHGHEVKIGPTANAKVDGGLPLFRWVEVERPSKSAPDHT
jgi:hypothetical protein